MPEMGLKMQVVFFRQLATMVESGLPVLKGLEALRAQFPNPSYRRFMTSLSTGVSSGATLGDSGESSSLRASIDRFLLGVPLLGGFIRKLAVARFTMAIGNLYDAGVPLAQAVAASAKTCGNVHLCHCPMLVVK